MLSLSVVGSYYLRQAYGCTHVQKQGEKNKKSCTNNKRVRLLLSREGV